MVAQPIHHKHTHTHTHTHTHSHTSARTHERVTKKKQRKRGKERSGTFPFFLTCFIISFFLVSFTPGFFSFGSLVCRSTDSRSGAERADRYAHDPIRFALTYQQLHRHSLRLNSRKIRHKSVRPFVASNRSGPLYRRRPPPQVHSWETILRNKKKLDETLLIKPFQLFKPYRLQLCQGQ